MLVRISPLLSAEELELCRMRLAAAEWIDGRITAGEQSAKAKHNLQLAEDSPAARELGELILARLGRNPEFVSAALPLRVFPPLVNRYDPGMGFGAHVDNALRHVSQASGLRLRTDLSATLFLTDPADYDGGELVIEDSFGEQRVKFAAGDMALYPASSLHRVEPVTRGSRRAAFFWIQSMVRDDGARALLHGFDQAIRETRSELSDDSHAVKALTATYHNLLRRWAEL